MSVGLCMIAKDEAAHIDRALNSVLPLIDTWTIVDTGSTDGTRQIAEFCLRDVDGAVVDHPWEGFAEARTFALEQARGTADWLLMLDADMTADAHPDLRAWLDTDPDPDVSAWQVQMHDSGMTWRLPWLLRGNREWRFEGAVHEWLVGDGKQRPLLGLTLNHHGGYKPERSQQYIDALAEGVQNNDPRSVYYTGWALRAMGKTEEAAGMFQRRAEMEGTWEEEAWHAAYMAAVLRQDVPALLAAHQRRPWRHEPLSAAANIIRAQAHDDLLFLEA